MLFEVLVSEFTDTGFGQIECVKYDILKWIVIRIVIGMIGIMISILQNYIHGYSLTSI